MREVTHDSFFESRQQERYFSCNSPCNGIICQKVLLPATVHELQGQTRGGPTLMHESLQVLSVFGWKLSRDHDDINALNL